MTFVNLAVMYGIGDPTISKKLVHVDLVSADGATRAGVCEMVHVTVVV